ncbi:uncharacterized protein TRAVEDRAFT_61646, partial [Trametes versicolor FP-101664 SS1]
MALARLRRTGIGIRRSAARPSCTSANRKPLRTRPTSCGCARRTQSNTPLRALSRRRRPPRAMSCGRWHSTYSLYRLQ